MHTSTQTITPTIDEFFPPLGFVLPPNVVLTEDEAARFLREPVSRLRNRRFTGTGPVFVRRADETWGARYLVWDLLAWLCQDRRAAMPDRLARSTRRPAPQAA